MTLPKWGIPSRVVQFSQVTSFVFCDARNGETCSVVTPFAVAGEMDASDATKPCQGQIRIAFQSEDLAVMVKQCMDVDDELQPTRMTKDIVVDGASLLV